MVYRMPTEKLQKLVENIPSRVEAVVGVGDQVHISLCILMQF